MPYRITRRSSRLVAVVLTATLSLIGSMRGAAAAQSVEQFYSEHTIKIHSSAGSGSGYTLWARFIGAHLGRFIPGHPKVVTDSMPGAGGLIAANYI